MYSFKQEVIKMFFSKPGEYEPCGILTTGHLVLMITTIIAVLIALKSEVFEPI